MFEAPNTFRVRLGQNIAAARKSVGMTQQEFSKSIGKDRSTLAHMELGTQAVLCETIAAIAAITGTPLTKLIPLPSINLVWDEQHPAEGGD